MNLDVTFSCGLGETSGSESDTAKDEENLARLASNLLISEAGIFVCLYTKVDLLAEQ
jgi:hypothetical protein